MGDALSFILKNSKSIYSPYHNLNHNVTATVFAYYTGKSEKLSKEEMKELLIAAIFHDYNHTAGESKDDVNIKNAKKGVKQFVEENKVDVNLEKIDDILDATEFPYKIEDDKLNIQQKIIRDVDLMQLFEPMRLQFNYLGLQKEAGITFEKQLENQQKFYKILNFKTKFGKELYKKFSKEINDEIDYLISLKK